MTKYTIKKIYDPNVGKFIREIKSSNILNVSTGAGPVTVPAGGVLCSYTTDPNTTLYLTYLYVYSTVMGNDIYIRLGGPGGPIYLPIMVGFLPTVINTTKDAPLLRIPENTLIEVLTVSGGTFIVSFGGILEPIPSKVETV
jgi:hypothetical protein